MHDEMEDYPGFLKGTDKANSTVKQYRKGLEEFSDWIAGEGLEVEEVETRDVQRFLSFLKTEREFAPKTIRLRFTAVSQFYKDLEIHDSGIEDPTDDVRVADFCSKATRREEVTKEKHIWLSKDEVRQLVGNVPTPGIRNRLLIMFQYYTGLRRQEVADVKLEDIDREERRVRVRGKNNTIQTVHWQPRLDGLMSQWLDGGFRASSPYAEESEYLFLSNRNEKMTGSRINEIVKIAAENAGLQEVLYEDARGAKQYKVTSNILRHSFGMHYLQNGGSMEALSKLMAHSSLATTQTYADVLEDRAKEEYEEFAPDIEIEF